MIGIFDSGIGGLTVMKEFLKRFPDFDYLYLGDQANVPYGSRSPELINKLVEKNVAWMIKQGCQLIIIACNTASAEALRHVQRLFVIPSGDGENPPDKGDKGGLRKGGVEGSPHKPVILGVLVPAVEEALRQTRFGNIGVIGTRGTIASGAYEREIQKRADVRIYPQPCPLLVPLIEEGWAGKPETNRVLKKYLRPLKNCHVDTLILACTHYPILKKEIKRIMGKNVRIVDSGEAAAEAMKSYFERHPDVLELCHLPLSKGESVPPRRDGRGSGGEEGPGVSFFTTDSPARFSELGSKFLGKKIKAERVEIS